MLRRNGPEEKGGLLFDLAKDPEETRNLIDIHPAEAKRLRGEIEKLDALVEHSVAPSMDEEALEKLRSLGYVD